MPDSKPLQTLSISEAAEAVGVTIHSIRRWADWHSAHLSPGANPASGQAKRFAGRDIEVLRHVKTLRDEGLQTIAINAKLVGITFPVVEPVQAHPEPEPQAVAIAAPVAPESRSNDLGPLLAQYATKTEIELLVRSVSDMRSDIRDRWWYLVAGIGIGIGLALVFELAAMVARR